MLCVSHESALYYWRTNPPWFVMEGADRNIRSLRGTPSDILGFQSFSLSEREFGPDAYVPDAFLAEVEERCVAIDQMQDRLAKCKNKGRKQSIEESLRYLAESLKDYIENVNN